MVISSSDNCKNRHVAGELDMDSKLVETNRNNTEPVLFKERNLLAVRDVCVSAELRICLSGQAKTTGGIN
jgi:hypothetical protein